MTKMEKVEVFNGRESFKELNKIIEAFHPDIIAAQLCSVQPIDTSILKGLFSLTKEEKQSYYNSLPRWVKDIKQIFNKRDLFYSYYNADKQIVYLDYNKKFSIDNTDDEIIDNSQTDIDVVNNYCKNHNLEVKATVSKIHDFFTGWFKQLIFEIKEK